MFNTLLPVNNMPADKSLLAKCTHGNNWLIIAALFLLDFLQCLHTLLALSMENQDALFHHFALLALAGVAALGDQRLFLLFDLPYNFL